MNKEQRIMLGLVLVLVFAVFLTAPHYYVYGEYGQNKVRCESDHIAAQMDIGKTLMRIFIVCLIGGGIMWMMKDLPKK